MTDEAARAAVAERIEAVVPQAKVALIQVAESDLTLAAELAARGRQHLTDHPENTPCR